MPFPASATHRSASFFLSSACLNTYLDGITVASFNKGDELILM